MDFGSRGCNDPVADMLRHTKKQNEFISIPTSFPPLPPKGRYAHPDTTHGQWERADAKHWYTPCKGHHGVVPQRPTHAEMDCHVYGFAGTGSQMMGLQPYSTLSMRKTDHMRPPPVQYPYDAHVFRGQHLPRKTSGSSRHSATSSRISPTSARRRYNPLDPASPDTPFFPGSPGYIPGTENDMEDYDYVREYQGEMPPLVRE